MPEELTDAIDEFDDVHLAVLLALAGSVTFFILKLLPSAISLVAGFNENFIALST